MKVFFRLSPVRFVILFLLFSVLVASCSPANIGSQETMPSNITQRAPVDTVPPKEPTLTPYENQIPVPAGAKAAQEQLAKRLNVSVDQITISEIEQEQWPNACLGLQRPDEMCADVITDGFRVMLVVNGKSYEAHTDLEGTQVRFADEIAKGFPQRVTPQPGSGAENPPGNSVPGDSGSDISEKVRQALSKKAGIDLDQIKVVSVEWVEWPDGCLGIRTRGVACLQVITPGYRVILEANGETFEFHTDEQGNTILQAGSAKVERMDAELVWEQTESGVCSQIMVTASEVSAGQCGKIPEETTLTSDQMKELAYFEDTYTSFTAVTESGKVTFTGSGTLQASEAEQRSLAEWAHMLYQETTMGRGGASVGLALVWHREGGIAGFCNDLSIYRSGWAQPATCKAGQVKNMNAYRITTDELEQLYAWLDQFENFEYENKDPAVADAMTIKMVFIGTGSAQASAAQREEISAFAASVNTSAARQP